MKAITRKNRTRKLTVEQRIEIITLYKLGNITMCELGILYAVSQPRISQIVNDVYGEFEVVE